MTSFYLHGDFHFGNTDGLYKSEERWDDYDTTIHVRRIKYSVFDKTEFVIADKIVNNSTCADDFKLLNLFLPFYHIALNP